MRAILRQNSQKCLTTFANAVNTVVFVHDCFDGIDSVCLRDDCFVVFVPGEDFESRTRPVLYVSIIDMHCNCVCNCLDASLLSDGGKVVVILNTVRKTQTGEHA